MRLVFPPVPSFNRRCYETIGKEWHWRDRLQWSDDAWARWLATPGVRSWEFLFEGRSGVGYAELATDLTGSTENPGTVLAARSCSSEVSSRWVTMTLVPAIFRGHR